MHTSYSHRDMAVITLIVVGVTNSHHGGHRLTVQFLNDSATVPQQLMGMKGGDLYL